MKSNVFVALNAINQRFREYDIIYCNYRWFSAKIILLYCNLFDTAITQLRVERNKS